MIRIDARWALTESGWRPHVRLHVGEDGRIVSIDDAPAAAVQADPLTELPCLLAVAAQCFTTKKLKFFPIFTAPGHRRSQQIRSVV